MHRLFSGIEETSGYEPIGMLLYSIVTKPSDFWVLLLSTNLHPIWLLISAFKLNIANIFLWENSGAKMSEGSVAIV